MPWLKAPSGLITLNPHDKADMEEIETVLVKKNAVESSRLMRKILMGQA